MLDVHFHALNRKNVFINPLKWSRVPRISKHTHLEM